VQQNSFKCLPLLGTGSSQTYTTQITSKSVSYTYSLGARRDLHEHAHEHTSACMSKESSIRIHPEFQNIVYTYKYIYTYIYHSYEFPLHAQSIAAVRAAAELQARATAEAQAEDMLVEAAEVQARASEIRKYDVHV